MASGYRPAIAPVVLGTLALLLTPALGSSAWAHRTGRHHRTRRVVDDFDGHPGKLQLRPGTHRIGLVTPNGETYERKVTVLGGHEMDLKLDPAE